LRPYPESKAGFQVVCADIMLNNEGRPYILEINRRCGFSYGTAYEAAAHGTAYEAAAHIQEETLAAQKWKKMNHQFSLDFFNWVYKSVIYPHFYLSNI